MTIAIAQGISAEATLSSGVATLVTAGMTTSASGSAFIIVVREYSPATLTVTDSFTNTYTSLASQANGGTTLSAWLCVNGSGGATHKPKLTKSSGDLLSCSFIEVTGAVTSSATDGTVGAGLDSSSPFNATVATSNATDLIITVGASNSVANPTTYTPGTGFTLHSGSCFTNGTNADTIGVMYQRVTSTGTYGGNFTTSSGSNAAVITFALKEAAAAASRQLLSMLSNQGGF